MFLFELFVLLFVFVFIVLLGLWFCAVCFVVVCVALLVLSVFMLLCCLYYHVDGFVDCVTSFVALSVVIVYL